MTAAASVTAGRAGAFLSIALSTLVLLATLYALAFRAQFGSPVTASWWIKHSFQYKDHIAAGTPGPKILVAGGSNALFGLDSRTLERGVGYPAVNLAAHAELSLGFYYHKIARHIGEGDIVVLPLEFHYYSGEATPSRWFVNNMLAWGEDDFLRRASLPELLTFVAHTPKSRVLEGLWRRGGNPHLKTDRQVIDGMTALLREQAPAWRGYSVESLNRYGDIGAARPPAPPLAARAKTGIPYRGVGENPGDHFVAEYRRIERLVARHNGRLFLTWPATLRNPGFDLSVADHRRAAGALRRRLRERSIDIYCNPALFNLDLRFFFDTEYHLNRDGAAIRSENLAGCLKRALADRDFVSVPYGQALARLRRQEQRYRRFMLTSGAPAVPRP